MIIVYIFLLIIGFILLYMGAELFVDGAVAFSRNLGIPALIVGLTIVAMGTSLPETAVSLTAALDGNTQICIGNVVGSNILNVMLILGISALVGPLALSKRTLFIGVPFMIFCSLLLYIVGFNGIITMWEGCILLLVFLLYICILVSLSWKNKDTLETHHRNGMFIAILFLLLGLIILIVGSKMTVYSATHIARLFSISDRFIGLTIVALGTSLPELFTSVSAARKGNSSIAVGNIIGSNIYNILFIIGLTSQFSPIIFQKSFMTDALINILISILLLVLCLSKRSLTRAGGCILLAGYVLYFIYLL